MFYGAGAGKLPTASAVVADMVDSAIHSSRRKLIGWKKPETDIMDDGEEKSFRYLIRCKNTEQEIMALTNTGIVYNENGPVAFTTEAMTAKECTTLSDKLGKVESAIRILD